MTEEQLTTDQIMMALMNITNVKPRQVYKEGYVITYKGEYFCSGKTSDEALYKAEGKLRKMLSRNKSMEQESEGCATD